MDVISLSTPLESIGGFQKRFLPKLKRLGIKTVRDLLMHFPTRYEDWSIVSPIAELQKGDEKTVHGTVQEVVQTKSWQRRMVVTEALVGDASGSIRAVWFNQPYIGQMLQKGKAINLAGKVSMSKKSELYFSNPAYELVSQSGNNGPRHTARIVPIYPETKGLTSKGIRFILQSILERVEEAPEFLPREVLEKTGFPEIHQAILDIHTPERIKDALRAKQRFAFQDLFLLQLKNKLEKFALESQSAPPVRHTKKELSSLLAGLPFELTASQNQSLTDILGDIARPHPMNRLLQGDVGSGKTIIAGVAAVISAMAPNNLQTAFMAPTEILARQHYQTLTTLFGNFTGGIALLVAKEARVFYGEGLESRATKADLLGRVASGEVHIVVGTHTLIQKSVTFNALGLVVVDEQHRFGVRQRATLVDRGRTPKNTRTDAGDSLLYKDLTYEIRGAAFEIKKQLGLGHKESVYQKALAEELSKRGIEFNREKVIDVKYRGKKVGVYQPDFVVDGKIIVELKALAYVGEDHQKQLWSYLKGTPYKVALLINFGSKDVEIKRVVFDSARGPRTSASSPRGSALVPHFLSMSATPIPRTLMMAIFGNLDVSLITELPAGRRAVITKIVDPKNRDKAYAFIRGEVRKGRQVYVVCPRIEKSEGSGEVSSSWDDVRAVEEEHKKLSKQVFPDLLVAMIHGRLKTDEKKAVMKQFSGGGSDLLVSTSVIEVGIDVPNATIMMIESAERFGLAQLYQLRGRVGRGEHQSFCFLFTESHTPTTHRRLRSILTAKNSFELAEKDLEIRGPGEFLGESQSGLPDIAMTAIQNPELLKDAEREARKIVEQDPEFNSYPELKKRLAAFEEEVHLE